MMIQREAVQAKLLATHKDLSTVSGRLSAWMDLAGDIFPRKKPDRVNALVRLFGVSRTSVYNWITEDQLPRKKVFEQIVEQCLLSLGSDFNNQEVMAWIEYGDAIPNIFGKKTRSSPDLTLEEIALTIRTMLQAGKSLAVPNLEQVLPEEEFNHILEAALQEISSRPFPRSPNQELINSLLKQKLKSLYIQRLS